VRLSLGGESRYGQVIYISVLSVTLVITLSVIWTYPGRGMQERGNCLEIIGCKHSPLVEERGKSEAENGPLPDSYRPLGTDHIDLALTGAVDLSDPIRTFNQVLGALGDEVTIYPTENYLYFRFKTGEDRVRGNMRLPPSGRDERVVYFAYYTFKLRSGDHEFNVRSIELGPPDGLELERIDGLTYFLRFGPEELLIHLNKLVQKPPPASRLRPGEVWVQNARDESGINFSLVFDRHKKEFRWILDERNTRATKLRWVGLGRIVQAGELIVDYRTGFVFLLDEEYGCRKVLVGVDETNVKKNNYYDGPFDQLAVNYVDEESRLADFIHQVFPLSKGRIDRFGKYLHRDGARVAITPYAHYSSLSDIVDWVKRAFTKADKLVYRPYEC